MSSAVFINHHPDDTSVMLMNVHDPNNNDDLDDNGISESIIDGIQKEFVALVKVSVCFFIVNLLI